MGGTKTTLQSIGENTPVRIGVVLGVLGFVVASVFWAATLQADVAYIKANLSRIEGSMGRVVSDHEARLRHIEQSKGS